MSWMSKSARYTGQTTHQPAAEADLHGEVEALGREVYGDRFAEFVETPRPSLASETPASLIERGDFAPLKTVLIQALEGDFGWFRLVRNRPL
jgi:hypothetical protein